jgi:hypothetical protein
VVEVEASVAGEVARAAVERNNGDKRALVMRIRRMYYLLGVNSNHHDLNPNQ